jgi:hypothetical protein
MSYQMHSNLWLVLQGRYTAAQAGSAVEDPEAPLSFAPGEEVSFLDVGLGFRAGGIVWGRLGVFGEMTLSNVVLKVEKVGVDFEERGLSLAGRGGLSLRVIPKMDVAAAVGVSRSGFEFQEESAAATWTTVDGEFRFYW